MLDALRKAVADKRKNERVAGRHRKGNKQGPEHRDRAESFKPECRKKTSSGMLEILKGANKKLQFDTDVKQCQGKLTGREWLTHSSRFRKLLKQRV